MTGPVLDSTVRGRGLSLAGDRRALLAVALIVAALLLPTLGGDTLRLLWRYERTAIAHGEAWRLLTAHVVHLGFGHAALNALGLALIAALFGREYSAGRWAVIAIVSALAVDAGLWWLEPGIDWYVGASGCLHGVLAAGALAAAMRRDPLGIWVLLVVAGKILYEQSSGALPFMAEGTPVVVAAHLYGALGGLAAGLGLILFVGTGVGSARKSV